MRLTGLFGAALLVLTFSGAANAYDHRYDRDHWRHDHWRHEHSHRDHWRSERPVMVRERPMIVERERPVFVQPAPMYAAPTQMPMQMPMYNQGPSGLNLNFNIPLN